MWQISLLKNEHTSNTLFIGKMNEKYVQVPNTLSFDPLFVSDINEMHDSCCIIRF